MTSLSLLIRSAAAGGVKAALEHFSVNNRAVYRLMDGRDQCDVLWARAPASVCTRACLHVYVVADEVLRAEEEEEEEEECQ